MVNRAAIMLVRSVSLAFRALGWRSCRFYPSCSEYAAGAFGRFSWPKALKFTVGRLLRCHPFHPGGFDAVPEKDL